MADFIGMTLTKRGLQLQAKAQAGTPLEFTRVAFGDGQLTGNQDIKELNALVHEMKSTLISSNKITGDGTITLSIIINNTGLATGFYMREIGVFATDPDVGEILYSVSNAGDYPDFLPAGTGNVVVEQQIDIITVVGNASNVTAVVDSSIIYVPKTDFNKIQADIKKKIRMGGIV